MEKNPQTVGFNGKSPSPGLKELKQKLLTLDYIY
jgi:hypothetical protein